MGSEKIFMFGEPSTGGRADLTAILPALMNNNKGIDPNILAMLGNRDGNGRYDDEPEMRRGRRRRRM